MLSDDLTKESNISVFNRSKMTVTGVIDVECFNSENIVFYTSIGELTVKGSNLKLTGLEEKTGILNIEGTINGIVYTNDGQKINFFNKLFR